MTYDGNLGVLTTAKDPNQKTTSYSYDTWGRITSVHYPNKCPNSSVSGETDYVYGDTVPSTIATTSAMCGVNSGASSAKVQTTVDGFSRAVRKALLTDPSGIVYVDTSYDSIGHVATVSNPYRSTADATYGSTSYSYDALGRITRITHPDNTNVSYYFYGAAVQLSDEGNGTRTTSRILQQDALGRLTSVCEVTSAQVQGGSSGDTTPAGCGQDISTTGFLTSYSYDPLSNLLAVTQGSLTRRSFQYDSLSRLTSAYNPEAGTTTYTYDGNNNVLTRTRPAPNQPSGGSSVAVATYAYDQLNRPRSIVYTDSYNSPSPGSYFDYDSANNAVFTTGGSLNPIGRLVDGYVKDSSGNYLAGAAFSYNEVGSPTSFAQCTQDDCSAGWNYTLSYAYDITGPVSSRQIASGSSNDYTLAYTYNGAGQLTTLASSWNDATHPGTLFSNGTYGPLGRLATDSLGSGEIESFAYDQRGRLGCLSSSKNGSALYSLSLSNANGQCSSFSGTGYAGNDDVLVAKDSINGNWTYTYDDFNRLISANASSGPFSGTPMAWTYDRFGNRWSQTSGSTGQSLSYTQGNNRMNAFNYDAAGNLTSDGTNSYIYDDENRIIKVNLGSGGTITYSYDAAGNRIRSNVGSTVEEYIYDIDGNQAGVMQPNGAMKRMEIFADGRHVGTYDIASNATYFSHRDWLGSERMRTTSAGTTFETCVNLPFGDGQQCSGGADISPMHFTSQLRDANANLDFFGARYGTSTLGRWLTPDWSNIVSPIPYGDLANPQALNLYSFTGNNPISSIDPDGHDEMAPEGDGGGGGDSDGGGGALALQREFTCTPCSWLRDFFEALGSGGGAGWGGFGGGLGGSNGGGLAAFARPFVQAQINSASTPAHLGPFSVPSDGPIRKEFDIDAIVRAEKVIGDSQCVTACKHFATGLANIPTWRWIQGPSVSTLTAADIGTAIATFNRKGRYPGGEDKNSGIYLGPGPVPGSIIILDQWPANPKRTSHPGALPPGPRPLYLNNGGASDSASHYYVIWAKP
ncbi:hypothetical protein DYQ86_09610 [Acidobacteria bacterium AB60]|nr:hypothetical protein DYQ86_09610 [Acidobacteria bacterium AB60]